MSVINVIWPEVTCFFLIYFRHEFTRLIAKTNEKIRVFTVKSFCLFYYFTISDIFLISLSLSLFLSLSSCFPSRSFQSRMTKLTHGATSSVTQIATILRNIGDQIDERLQVIQFRVSHFYFYCFRNLESTDDQRNNTLLSHLSSQFVSMKQIFDSFLF